MIRIKTLFNVKGFCLLYLIFLLISIFFLLIYTNNGLCQKGEGGENKSDIEDKVIVNVGEKKIKGADFNAYLSYRPLPPPNAVTNEVLGQRLNEIITSEALYQEALRLGMDQAPDVRRNIQQILVQKLFQEKKENYVWNRKIDEKELQDYYEKYKYEFNRPEQIRLADIFIALDPNASPEQRAEKKKKAESVLAELKGKGKGRYYFVELIKKYSDKHPKYPRGDTTFFDAEGKPAGIDKKLAEEGFKLKMIGDIGDHAIETSEGFHIIMLSERRPGYNKPLEEVKTMLERRIRREEAENTREGYIKQVIESADIQRDEQAIIEVFEAIKEAYVKKHQQEQEKFLPKYRNMSAPPPFPGEDY